MKKIWIAVLLICTLLLLGCIDDDKAKTDSLNNKTNDKLPDDKPDGVTGSAEVWSGWLTGETVGVFICLEGHDSYYIETGSLTFVVSAPGMEAAINSYEITDCSGAFSNIEYGIEASGLGCTLPPSVSFNSVEAPVDVRISENGIQVQSNTILLLGHFDYRFDSAYMEDYTDVLDSKEIILTPNNITATTISGTWKAIGAEHAGSVYANGEFFLEKVSSEDKAIAFACIFKA